MTSKYDLNVDSPLYKIFLNNLVPLKVLLFVWRLLNYILSIYKFGFRREKSEGVSSFIRCWWFGSAMTKLVLVIKIGLKVLLMIWGSFWFDLWLQIKQRVSLIISFFGGVRDLNLRLYILCIVLTNWANFTETRL